MTSEPSPELMFKQWFAVDCSEGSHPPLVHPMLVIAGNAEGLAYLAMLLLDAASSVVHDDVPDSVNLYFGQPIVNEALSDRMSIKIFKLPADERRSTFQRALGFTPEDALQGNLFETYERIAKWARNQRDEHTEPPTE